LWPKQECWSYNRNYPVSFVVRKANHIYFVIFNSDHVLDIVADFVTFTTTVRAASLYYDGDHQETGVDRRLYQWRTQVFCSGGEEVQQIQLRTEDRENGDLGAVAP